MVSDTSNEFDERFDNRRPRSTPCASVIPLGIRSTRKSALVAGPGVSAIIDVAIGYPLRLHILNGHLAENDACIGNEDIGHVCNSRAVNVTGSSVR